MKTKIRTLIAIIALGTIGFTNINAIADNKSMANATIVTEKEEMLAIESWMTNENNWLSNDYSEQENSLAIESWMTNDNYWSPKAVIASENEDTLKVEAWMLNESLWN